MSFLEPEIEREERDSRQQRRQTQQRQASRRHDRREMLNKRKSPKRSDRHEQDRRRQGWSGIRNSRNPMNGTGSGVTKEGGRRRNLPHNDLRRRLPSCKYYSPIRLLFCLSIYSLTQVARDL